MPPRQPSTSTTGRPTGRRRVAGSCRPPSCCGRRRGIGHLASAPWLRRHVEEISEREARAQIETNLFGALWVTLAALPFLREQGSGHIIQVSSIGGISAFPSVGIYHASKWGLEGISQALAQEVKEFGINLTLVEPGGFSTDWSGSSSKRSEPNPAHDGLRERQQHWRASNVEGRLATWREWQPVAELAQGTGE
ncbi:MAG: SDR family NAD(P)-dependent oxidoreductase [Solirubrobacteraceae bacterium]|jgi:NAD(P)-dependent dehydrogenase (short-subunit alcohol dehydrogenase family)